jgi:hypothetical protein
MVIFLN